MKITIEALTEGPGYSVLDQWVPLTDLKEISEISLVPHRGKTAEGLYWTKEESAVELALWWSQQVRDHPAVQRIARLCVSVVQGIFAKPEMYSADCIVNTALNRQNVYPHQDTPYRFSQWQHHKELLAVQFLVPLQDFTANNGATAVVDHSYRYLWETSDLYAGVYDRWFRDNLRQVEMRCGDILAYNPRLVHSTMPNLTDCDRRALLISVMDHTLAETLIDIDNIWR